MSASFLEVPVSVSLMRSGLTALEDGVSETRRVSWSLVGAGAFVVALGVDLVPVADFGLLDVLDLLEVFGLLAALAAGLGALLPLVTAAIGASGCDGVRSKISVRDVKVLR